MAVISMRSLLLAIYITRSSCTPTQVDGSGTTNPSKFFWKVMQMMEARTRADIRLTYRAVGSSTGQKEFMGNPSYTSSITHFGSGDIPMSSGRYTNITTTGGRTMYHIPFAVGAIGLFHSIPIAEVGNDGLKLSPCNLAKIFTGVIENWDDPLIKADNPNLMVPANTKIRVGHRTLGSSSTSGLAGYLSASCSGSWTLGTGSTLDWGSLSAGNFTAVQGSPGMVDHIEGVPYAIGYLDAGHGHQKNFQEVMLNNTAGTWLTSSQSLAAVDGSGNNGVSAAAASATNWPSLATDDWSSFNLYNQGSGTNDWPIVLVSYIYLNADISSMTAAAAGLLVAFVDTVLSDEGQNMLADFSFNKIPANRNTWTTALKTSMTTPAGMIAWTMEPSTEAITGQGDYVISSKRNSYSMWQLGEVVSSMSSMETRLASLEQNNQDYGVVALHGSGTTNPKNWFSKAMKLMEQRSRSNLFLTYRAVGSGTGMREFVGHSNNSYMSYNHFGCGDIPVSNSLYTSLPAGQEMLHIPFAHSALAVFHSVPGVPNLKLTPCLLARILDGAITTWDHADIAAENTGVTLPAQTIIVGHRRLGSSSTGGITGYVESKCPGSWTRGSGSTITWPSGTAFKEVEGSPGMQTLLQTTDYAIGYLDAGHGHDLNLAEISLQNTAGTYLTSKQSMAQNGVADAGTAGVADNVFPTDHSADWSAVNLYGMAGTNVWPIVLTSYFYVKKDQTKVPVSTAAALKAFVTFIVDNKDSLAAEFGFTPLSTNLKDRSMAALESVVFPSGMAEYTFETDTAPYTGMGANVISTKRHAYDDYDRGLLTDRITKLETEVLALSGSGVVALHGSGTTNPKSLFAKVMKMMEDQAKIPLFLTYRAVGSSTGQKEFVGQASSGWRSYNHFGAGDIPMDQGRYNSLPAGQEMVHVPFALGAIGIFHSVAGQSVNMDACLLAKVFAGTITTWDHADIMAQNPNLNVPANQLIKVGHRVEGSSSTGGLTGYLHKKCQTIWTTAGGSTHSWSSSAGFTPVQGSPGMEALIKDTPFAIGYLDAGHGISRNFAEIKLVNAAGQSRTAKESIALDGVAEAGTQGVNNNVFPTSASDDWSAVNLYDMGGTNTWPIVLVSYFYVKKDQTATNPRTAAALKAFVEMVLANPGNVLADFGFTPPSSSLKNKAEAGLRSVTWPTDMVSYTWEDAATTQPYVGMGDSVISGKRFAYDDLERDLMSDSVATLQASISALQADVAAQQTKITSMSNKDDDDHDHDVDGLAIASLVVACLAIAISGVATALALRS